MARNESDREDIMREAGGLPRRVSFESPESTAPTVVGFRPSGGMSIYFGADPVYQFDASGGLRRAYRAGYLYRTQSTTLARLERQRSAGSVTLSRHDLTPTELMAFLGELRERLITFQRELAEQTTRVVARVPCDDPVEVCVKAFLSRLLDPGGLSTLAPAVRGKH